MRGDVERFKRRTGKPVVAACQDVAASGGYYVAVAADEIYAAPGGIVGSIGVVLNTFDLSALLDKVGVAVNPITSGPLKDLGSPFDDLSDRERDVLQGVVDAFYEQFRDVVTASRDVSDQEAAFDGRVYTSGQAVEAGLVDAVASLDQAITRAARLGGSPRARAIQYTRPYGYRGSIYAGGSALQAGDRVAGPVVLALPGAERLERLTRLLEPGAYYLWMP